MTKLKYLDLGAARQITDGGALKLANLKNLTTLRLPAAILPITAAELQRKLPQCRITR
jgi:hypothetical protein